MMQISTPLVVTPMPDGVLWMLVEDFLVVDDVKGEIRVPKGFQSDFGSVPKLFRNIISPTGKGVWGFVLHDWEYGTQTMSRDDADHLLIRWLEFCGEDTVESNVIFDALRIGGEIDWDEDKSDIEKNLSLLTA
jgi:hypothetical protein